MPEAIKPDKILHDLAKLWSDLADPGHGASTASGVLRACAMTLIVAAEDEVDAQAASGTVAELIHEHPSRAILLKPSKAGELDARVFAQCWMPFGGRQQICCEQIEIAASSERLGDVPGLLLSLIAPDLPAVLWCRGARWFAEPHFREMLPLTTKVIVDSGRFPDAATAFATIGELMAGAQKIADLSWARITGWREIISRLFDTPAELARAGQIAAIRVGYSGDAPPPEACYMAAWLKRALPSATATLVKEPGGAVGLRSVTLDGISVQAGAGSALEVRTAEGSYAAVLSSTTDCAAMRQELSITRRDTIFEQVFTIARQLAPAKT
jgi:glucose-6-phosphate dehydrogenase assembly protein OpcA